MPGGLTARRQAVFTLSAGTPAGTLPIVATFTPADPLVAKGSASVVSNIAVRTALSSTGLTVTWTKVGQQFELTLKATVPGSTGIPAVGTVSFNVNGREVSSVAVAGGSQQQRQWWPGDRSPRRRPSSARTPNVSRSGKTVTVTVR